MNNMRKFILLVTFFIIFSIVAYSQTEGSTGTGFFISDEGILVTCYHVIEDADAITVRVGTTEYPATVLARNPGTDLAILQIKYRSPNYFRITSFNTANLGDKVYVLGFPLSNFLGSDIRVTLFQRKAESVQIQPIFSLVRPYSQEIAEGRLLMIGLK